MTVDLVMGALGALIGAALLAQSGTLAACMKEADDRYREHPWLQVFEPTAGPLATDSGRMVAFRVWFLASGAAFVAIGAALLARALVL